MITVIIELEKRWTVKKRKKLLAFLPPLRFRPKINYFLSFCRSQSAIMTRRLSGFGLSAVHSFSLSSTSTKKRFSTQGSLKKIPRTKIEMKKSLDIFFPSSENYTPLCSLLMCVFSFFTIFPKSEWWKWSITSWNNDSWRVWNRIRVYVCVWYSRAGANWRV